MASIDDRVVAMSFDNAKFEAGVAKTLVTLAKLNDSLKNIGATHGLGNLEKAASKINLTGPLSALDKLKEKLHLTGATKGLTDVDAASRRISFSHLGTAIDSIKSRLSNFASGPAAALSSLKGKLNFANVDKNAISFPGAEKRFADIEKASNTVKLGGVVAAVSNVKAHFGAMTVVAGAALGTIASKATMAGGRVAKSFSIGPISAGLQEYTTNLNSIQTILANTKASGAGLNDVNAALKELNLYSDQTIYNFSQMAKNIGTFTAAGVDLKTSTSAIKGIANLAALSGSNSEQASTAMYQLSQALASGKVSLQDWNSVVNAGMGGTVFQRALAQNAVKMGTLNKSAVALKGPMKNVSIEGQSFRDSIAAKPGEKSWLSSDVLTGTLKQFTGDLSDAELAAQGFNEAEIKSIQQTAIMAKKAATEVKTIQGVFDVAKESMGSGWAATFQLLLGDFGEAKTSFTALSGFFGGFIKSSADARNKVLEDWKDLGGRKILIEGIKNAWQALISIMKPVKEAFREIFPRKTGADLLELTKNFRDFTENLKIGPETAENLKRTFAGFFAVLSIGKQIIGGILGVFGKLLGATSKGSGGFLNFTGSIGDFLVSVDRALKRGKGLSRFFDGLGQVLSAPITLLSKLGEVLSGLFEGGGDSKELSSSMGGMTDSLKPLSTALRVAKRAWDGFLNVLDKVKDVLGNILDEVGEVFGQFGDAIGNALEGENFDKVFQIIQTTLIGGIFLAIKKALGQGVSVDLGGGLLSKMSGVMDGLTGSLKAMQTNIKAGTLLKIAAAVALLAAGVVALSMIDPKKLASAMTVIAVGLGQLIGAMALLTKVGGASSFATMPFIAASMIMLAVAVDILAIAIFAFSKLSWEELGKGLLGVGGALLAVSVGMKAMPAGMASTALLLLPMAVALNILALAVKIFSTLSWEEMAKGLIGVAGALAAIGIGTRAIGPSILLVGPGLIAVAVALNLLAFAVSSFGNMSLATMAKGLVGIAASLVIIGIAITAIPPTVAMQAAGLILLSVGLTGIAAAVALMGGIGILKMAKGIIGLGAALMVLGFGLTFMAGTIPGAVALMGAATALAVLVPVLGILGSMQWSTIFKGLAAIAAVLGVLSVVGALAAPGLISLGIALVALGAGVSLVGAGLYLIAAAITKLGIDGAKGISALLVALTALVALLPTLIINFLKGIVDIAESIALLAPKVVDSMVKIIKSLLDVIIQSAPNIAIAVGSLILAMLTVIDAHAASIIASGFRLLMNFLTGIKNNIGQIVLVGSQIVIRFLASLITAMPQLMAAGTKLIITFLAGVILALPRIILSVATIISTFLNNLAAQMPRLARAGANLVIAFVNGIANNIGRVIGVGARLIMSIIHGIGNASGRIAGAAARTIGRFLEACANAMLSLVNKIANIIVNFLNGIAKAINTHGPRIRRAGYNVASAIVNGLIDGLKELFGKVISKLGWIVSLIPKTIRKILGIKSPSRVFMEIGGLMMEGMAIGIGQSAPSVLGSVRKTANDVVSTMTDTLSAVPDALEGLIVTDPVISPILDLSGVEQSAKKLDDLTNVTPITAAVSYTQAQTISSEQATAQEELDKTAPTTPPEIKFEQNNYSPESLSDIEIYRKTNNQLSQAKDMLGVA